MAVLKMQDFCYLIILASDKNFENVILRFLA